MSATMVNVCETAGCGKDSKLQCPTCIKLGIDGSFFCSQNISRQQQNKPAEKSVSKEIGASINKFTNKQIINLDIIHQWRIALYTEEEQKKSEDGNSVYNPWPGYGFTGKLRPHPVTPMRTVPDHIARPDYSDHEEGYPASERAVRGSTSIEILSEEDQESLRVACKLGREVLDVAAQALGVGVTTEEVDRLVHEACVDRECYPSPLNYYNFPKSCCTSINEVICHGIPDARPLVDGDICNVDITTYHRGYHGDLNETMFIGNVDETSKKLVKTTHECLMKAVALIKPGVKYREMGDVIQKHAQNNGFSVVRTYCGHGIHRLFHTAPSIPHYSKNKAVGIMKPGHAFTIEPMISEGTWRDQTWPDNWTAVTQDGKRSAQFEHTFLVTDTGCDILTKRLTNDGQPWFMDSL